MPTHAQQLLGRRLKSSAPLTWVFTGDSITHGALHTHGWRSYVEHFAERVRWEMQRMRDVVINTGISGERAPGLLADFDHRVLRFRPDVVSIMIGMNDATEGQNGHEKFRSALDTMLDRLGREDQLVTILHTPNTVTRFEAIRKDLPAYAEIVRALARQHEVILVDQEKLWIERGGPIEYLLDDGTLHPNGAGHVLMTHHLLKAIDLWDPASAVCRFFVS